jgi:hypothetical protein
LDGQRHPDLAALQAVTLREGPRSRREAKYAVIRNRHTGAVHHDAVTIKSYKIRQGELREDVEHSVTLSNEGDFDEIQTLLDLLLAIRHRAIPDRADEYVLVTARTGGIDTEALQRAMHALSATERVDVLADVLERVSGDPDLLRALVQRAVRDPELFAEAAAALNLATYHRAIQDLRALVERRETREAEFQSVLQANPWMFGSEYSELLDRRRWTRDEQQDFVVRRTADGYIELIEIKTPLGGAPLFIYDRSHDSYYPSADLSRVLGQVQKYIDRLDADRNAILVRDGEDTAKVRAKIIIGRDGEPEHQVALRRLNGHLHRIEVITFDQLLRIAQNVTRYLRRALRPAE